MIRILLFCALAQTVMSNATMSSKEIAEALKYFEAMHAKNNEGKEQMVLTTTPPSTMPNSLLAALHNIQTLPEILPLGNPLETKPLLESRENYDTPNAEYRHHQLKQLDGSEKKPVADENFMNLLQNLLKEGIPVNKDLTPNKNPSASVKDQAERRRMLEWFTSLFAKDKITTTTEAFNIGVIPRDMDEDDVENSYTSQTTADILVKLNNILEKLNQNIELELLKANKSDAFVILKLPVKQKMQQVEPVELPDPYTFPDTHYRVKRDIRATNVLTNDTKESVNKVNDSKVEVTGDSFKSKILAHLIDSFNEIKYKIAPLKKIKERHASSDLYKIGYIAASVDTLEGNLNTLMEELEKNKNVWDEHKILEFFDRLKTSNRVLRTLMEHLGMLADKKLIYEVKDLKLNFK